MEKMFNVGAATMLDPRFMKVPFVDPSNAKCIEDRLVNIMRTEYNQSVPPAVPDVPSTEAERIRKDPPKKAFVWKNFEARVEKSLKTSHSTLTGPHIEMRRFMEESLISWEMDPLNWWKLHSPLFPKLQDCAKKFLCIPATSVPSERLFSKAGELVSQKRSSLSDDNINMILFLNKNK